MRRVMLSSRLPALRWLVGATCIALAGTAYLVWAAASGSGNARTQAAQAGSDAGTHSAVRDLPLEASLRQVDEALLKFRPGHALAPERRQALAALDAILHEEDAPARAPLQRFFHRRIEQLLAQLQANVRSGATIWHVYNHGFVVRTASATLCFDLVRPKYLGNFALDEPTMRRIVDACDVLFVSHAHADHAENFVAQSFIEQGKPVVAPEQIGYRASFYSAVTHLEPAADKVYSVSIKQGTVNLGVVVFPGHQDIEMDNNVVLVTTPEGISVAHTGDQWQTADFSWIDRVSERYKVDILLPNDWTYDIARLVRGFNPAVVVPGHSNELGHEPEKRQPYLLGYQRKSGSGHFGGSAGEGYVQPLVVLAWGESFHYQPAPR
jgi:L-ascorbate metabolism protein UlaG (beta-lactamase superfamily)